LDTVEPPRAYRDPFSVAAANEKREAAEAEAPAKGETPILITWDYKAINAMDAFAGNPKAEMVIPKTGQLAGLNVQAISAYAPHLESAKLWMEFLYSDEGQLLRMKGYCHSVREFDLRARGVIPSDEIFQTDSLWKFVRPDYIIDRAKRSERLKSETLLPEITCAFPGLGIQTPDTLFYTIYRVIQ
jgi:ABC-type Fe3+ transport system substrate-binding protein